jgi:hypothetical protein
VKKKEKAASLILRGIHSDYVIPVAVWQIREGIREALKKENREFESFENALSFACMNLSTSRTELIRNSKIHKNIKEQMRITDFFSNKNAL